MAHYFNALEKGSRAMNKITLVQWKHYVWALMFLSNVAFSNESPTVGKVLSIQGKAWLASDTQEKTKIELREDTKLHLNDLIVTGPNSQVRVVLGTKEAAVLLKPETIVRLIQSSQQTSGLEIGTGSLLAHIRKPDSRLEIKTRSAIIGLRGSTAFIDQKVGKDVFFCACQGVTTIDQKVIILGKDHNAPKYIQVGQQPLPSRLKTAPSDKNHPASDLASLTKALQ
jgi:hypothetical protein